MNSVEIAKNKLKSEGYCSFNVKDYNEDYYNFIKDNFLCNDEKNLKKHFTGIRATYKSKTTDETTAIFENYNSFEEANNKKLEILEDAAGGEQIWLYGEDGSVGIDLTGQLRNIVTEFIKYLYDINDDVELGHNFQYTYYNLGCKLPNHSDGLDMGRICACLIYFNENYDENNGGCLVLNNDYKIVPEMGNVAIIDLQKFEVPHQVTEVTGGLGRFAFISFVGPKT